jgi:hypothetical protein
LFLVATGIERPVRQATSDPYDFPLTLEIVIAAAVVIILWRLINGQEASFWAWHRRGWGPAWGAGLKMLGLYLFAAILTTILPVLTNVFDVHAESTWGTVFLIGEAVAAGLASMTFASRRVAARRETAERDQEEGIAGWLERALTACFVSLGENARAGVRERLAEALATDQHRLRLLSALRDYATDAGEDDKSPVMIAVYFMTEWANLGPADQDTTLDTVRDFVVERRIPRRRLIARNPRLS